MKISLLTSIFLLGAVALHGADATTPIDRHALVSRHNPVITRVDPWAPLSVGNGEFAFTADITGLQTFGDYYHQNGIPLETLARWAWHENANPAGYKLADANEPYTAYGNTVGYPTNAKGAAGQWLRENPQDMPIGQLALDLVRPNGAALALNDIQDIKQTLDLWSGVITSTYSIDGNAVRVVTACDPTHDVLAVRVESPLVASGKLGVRLAFPRGHDLKVIRNPTLDWTSPESHTTAVVARTDHALELDRTRDGTHYHVSFASSGATSVTDAGPHAFRIAAAAGNTLEFTLGFNAAARAVRRHGRARGQRRALGKILAQRWRGRFFRQQRSSRGRARAPRRALAISHGDPVRRRRSPAGERTHR